MERIQFLNIGYGNLISANRIIAMVSPDSAPVKRLIQEAKDKNILLDATYGRKTRCVILMDNGQIVLSPNVPETVGGRFFEAKNILPESSEKG
ncbi:MAG: DUF370 domain-containing protein [Epulopiscium sp.]|jgi:regulator of extracellular matrix RemA (YlzA/DUF370 family)|nr:DUF370 domain-containing protein [Candidatus Epulonipiscium sp.]